MTSIVLAQYREKGNRAFLLYLCRYRTPGNILGFCGNSYIKRRLPGASSLAARVIWF